ncbi:MAG TPA: hypothetical protein VHI11_08975 [Jiangellaceae bacterium]|nr:hypothetical protein [Jiangellaceae bacterium]
MAGQQFLILSFAEGLRAGGNARVVLASKSEDEAKGRLEGLDSSVLGRIAIVEVKQVFERKPAVENVPVDNLVIGSGS